MTADSSAFATPVPEAAIERARASLEGHGITALIVDTSEQAKVKALALIPDGATVAHGSSVTLVATGLARALAEPGRYDRLRVAAQMMERDHVALSTAVMKQLASSDYVVGSANAVTEDGSLLFGSMSGSQLGPYVSQASKVILIVGAQKIVKDVEAGLRRLREYVLPLESERVRIASGITDTRLNSILILSGSATPDRLTVILVRQAVGF